MAFNSLPKEILHNVISHRSPNYSLLCRNICDVASAVAYRDIDFTIHERGDVDANKKLVQRQVNLLTLIASNPHLGANVRSFNTIHPWGVHYVPEEGMGTDKARPETLIKAAQNMRSLTKASLAANPLALEIVTNLPSYTQLTDLTLQKCQPKEYIWPRARTTLKNLHWNIWSRHDEDETLPQTADFVIKVAESTCPDLESLDISFGVRNFPASVASSNIDQHQGTQRSESPKLTRLRHFGLTYHWADISDQAELKTLTTSFAALYSQSLNSISLPISYYSRKREDLDFILEVCASLPHLKELSLVETRCPHEGQEIGALEFLTELTSALARPNFEIERLSIDNIKVPYSPEVGKLFASLKSLKFLKVGDVDGGAEDKEGESTLDFEAYRPEVLKFIQALPGSLQEIYLEINGSGAFLHHDSEFDPLCNLGPQIFGTLKKLYTCDIHAWISNLKGGLGWVPEKAVFYRRLPHPDADSNTKIIWTSRMDCIYGGFDYSVLKTFQVMEGDFEGEDADEVWLDGYTNCESEGEVKRVDEGNYSWKEWADKVDSYAMFRRYC